jgi:hypothetical protein
MNKKILVLGLGQNNFLSFLYSALKKYEPSYTITVPFYNEITKGLDSFWFPYIAILPNIEFSSFWDEK